MTIHFKTISRLCLLNIIVIFFVYGLSIGSPYKIKIVNEQYIANGILLTKYLLQPQDATNHTITINLIKINPLLNEIRIIDSYSTIKKYGHKFSPYNLRSINQLLKPKVIINGGFSGSLSVPIPVGLLIIEPKLCTSLYWLAKPIERCA